MIVGATSSDASNRDASTERARARRPSRGRGAMGRPARERMSPYDVLEVSRGATKTEIKIAFRRRAKATHPDAENGDASGESFRACCAAYDALSDEVTRRMIDDGIVHAIDGFEFVEGAVRTTLRPDVRTAREARRGTKGRPVAPSALDAVVAAAPSDRDALLKRWYLKRAAAAWRRWCEAWYAAFHFGAPVAVALALARAAEIHAALEHVTTK